MFETILNNPGLQHLAEYIFFNLDVEHLQLFELLNQSSRQILEGRMFQDPMFWLKKFQGISIDNQIDWTNVIQSVNNSFKRKFVINSYLRWNLKKEAMVNLPCYTNPIVQIGLRIRILKICKKKALSDEDTEICRIFAPLTTRSNVAIWWAAYQGHTEIVKILSSLTDNPNAPDKKGATSIHYAVSKGCTEIVKILAPLTDNPNAPDKYGNTPIFQAAKNGHIEIVKIVASLTDNSNAPNNNGVTPIQVTKNIEILSILKSFITSAEKMQ